MQITVQRFVEAQSSSVDRVADPLAARGLNASGILSIRSGQLQF
jgi:hypothetical protein